MCPHTDDSSPMGELKVTIPHVLMLVSNPVTYDPRVKSEAVSLAERDWRVTIVGWDRRSQFIPEEEADHVKVLRLRNTGYMKLLPLDLLRLRPWWRSAYRRAAKLHRSDPFQVVHCHDLDTLPTGVRLKRKLGLHLVYDAHEIWPSMIAKDAPGLIVNHFFNLERRLMRHVDGLIIAEERYRDYFESIDAPKAVTVMNTKRLIGTEYEPPRNDVFTLLYIGTLTRARFLPQLVDVCGQLEGVSLVIGGLGRLYDYLEKQCESYDNVEFIGSVPAENVLPLTLQSDAVCCMVDPSVANNRIATANKQFEAMVCGRPIICTKDTRSGEITREENCGLVIDYTEDALREAVMRLRDSPEFREELGRNALEAAINKYNWENEEKRLLELYEKTGVIR